MGPHNLRAAAGDPGFLAAVLDYLLGDERLLVAFAADQNLPPERVATARAAMDEALTAFCRDCLAREAKAGRCARCGSPRLVSAAPDLTIAHVDCDAFYASVEKRDRPELRDQPLIIGGGLTRGVVSTCCYIARTSGVRSAMPMARALKLCPNAVVLKPDMAKYSAVSKEIRARMLALTPLVEPLSIDEAFLDLTGCEGALGLPAAAALARFAAGVEREIGVTVSVGLSYCKFLAKFASDLDKPRGFSVVGRGEAQALLAPLSVGRLWGVGEVARARLERLGVRVIGDLQRLEEREAMTRLGEDGRRLWRLARGIDERRVSPEREAKSVSAETTFLEDIGERAELEAALLGLCERVARRLREAESGGWRRDAEAAHARTSSCARGRAACRRRNWRRGCSTQRAVCWRRSRRGSTTG